MVALLTVGAAGAVPAVAMPVPDPAHQASPATAQLQSRVAAVRAALAEAPGTGTAVAAATVPDWTNWPKWSKWSNWANK